MRVWHEGAEGLAAAPGAVRTIRAGRSRRLGQTSHVFASRSGVTKGILASFICNPHFGKSYAVNLNNAHEDLQDLVERVTIELELISVAKELDR